MGQPRGRPRKQLFWASPLWRQALRAKFVSAVIHHCPDQLRLLIHDAHDGTITAHEWAARFNLAATWVEEWAADSLAQWSVAPAYYSNGLVSEVVFATPIVREMPADQFSYCIVESSPLCKFAMGVTRRGSLPYPYEDDDWIRFKKMRMDHLDAALEKFRQTSVGEGNTRLVLVPEKLDLSLELAALYLFCKIPAADLARHRVVSRDKSRVSSWLKETLKLLDLPLKRGRPPKNAHL